MVFMINYKKRQDESRVKMTDCIFCKIIKGDLPSRIVYENEDIVAFLDTSQATPGHTLVVPRRHVENIMAYDEDLASRVFSYIPHISRSILQAFDQAKGINIVNNNGEVAYQTVFHSHIHLIPRYKKEEGFAMTMENNGQDLSDEEFDRIAAAISQSIKDDD